MEDKTENQDKIVGVREVDGIRYYNMRKAYQYMKFSPQGWRNLCNKLVQEKKLQLWGFVWDPKSVYVKEEDLKNLNKPIPLQGE